MIVTLVSCILADIDDDNDDKILETLFNVVLYQWKMETNVSKISKISVICVIFLYYRFVLLEY